MRDGNAALPAIGEIDIIRAGSRDADFDQMRQLGQRGTIERDFAAHCNRRFTQSLDYLVGTGVGIFDPVMRESRPAERYRDGVIIKENNPMLHLWLPQ